MGGARVAWLLGLAALAACQPEPTGPVSVPLADAASIHLVTVATDDDWTSHIFLTTGYTVRLRVKLYTTSGREITPHPNPVDMSFTFNPTTLATASVADSVTLLFDITPDDPPGSDGGLYITLTEPSTATTKSFGPFYALVHPATAR